MIFNKSYLTTFSKTKPFLALASKGKILDSKFTLSSELSLYDYSLDKHYSALQTENEYCKISWCEKYNMQILAAGHTNGTLALYEPDTNSSFKLLKSFDGLTNKVLAIDYNPSKNVIAAGSEQGNIIFWNLDKLDQQYKCDIPIKENITSLSWNNKVSRILCAGTECGKILVLDIRAKNIAMTIQNKDIKNVKNVKWNPKCSTSIFASTNLNYLACFKLDANSMTQIGSHDSSIIDFNLINEDLVASYSDNKIDYIDIDTLSVKDSINVENVFDISFSTKDSIYCCSYNSGTTEVFSKSDKYILKENLHVQLNNRIVSRNVYKIENTKLEITFKNDIETEILDILYEDKVYKFDNMTRNKLGNLLLKNENSFFNLSDKLILNLIKNNIEGINKELEEEDRKISLKYIINLLINKKQDEKIDDSLYFLLDLIITKKYDKLNDFISSDNWKIMISILLFSELTDDEVKIQIRNITEKTDIPIINLIINEPRKYFNLRENSSNLPKSIFEVQDFFEGYGSEISNLIKLNLKYNNPVLNEYFWYGKNHGIFDQLKNINYEDEIIRRCINKKDIDNSDRIKVNNISDKPLQEILNKCEISNKTVINQPPKPSYFSGSNTNSSLNASINQPPKPSNYSGSGTNSSTAPSINQPPKPSLYSGSGNRSVTSFSTKPLPRTFSKDLNVPEKQTGFSTKPISSGKSLYMSSHNKSATSFSSIPGVNPPIAKSVSTYGQSLESNSSTSSFKSPVIPKPSFRSTFTPNNTTVPQTSTVQSDDIKYDKQGLAQSLEDLYENLKEQASKKNNLIVGNKIKDAVRRFSIFKEINKEELSINLIRKIEEIINLVKNETDKSLIKQKIRVLVDECIEIKICQCEIWIPAISILVQLVY